MVKTLEDINREFLEECAASADAEEVERAPETPAEEIPSSPSPVSVEIEAGQTCEKPKVKKKKAGMLRRLLDIAFYTAIASILAVAFVTAGRSDGGFKFFGYSGFHVITGSMEREIPTGSLVIVKAVAPKDIRVTDNITFVRKDNEIVTHKVVAIDENYGGKGVRGFTTWGVENESPDADIVHEANIIGVVKYSIPELGFALNYVAENIGFIFLVLGGVAVAAVALRWLFAGAKEEKRGKAERKSMATV